VPGQGQGEGSLGLVAGQSGRHIEDPLEGFSLRQVVRRIAGQLASDSFQLLAIGQGVFEDDEELLQLDRDLHQGRQHHQEGALLLAGDQLVEHRLHHFRIGQVAMELMEQQQRRAVVFGQGRQGTQSGQGIAGFGASGAARAGQAQAVGDVPDSKLPALLPGMLDDFAFGFVGFLRMNPQAGASGMDGVGQLFGQLHQQSVPSGEGFGDGWCWS
jgi:hypothetical protein